MKEHAHTSLMRIEKEHVHTSLIRIENSIPSSHAVDPWAPKLTHM